MKREVNQLPQGSPEHLDANARYKQEFPTGPEEEAKYGQTIGQVTRSPDGKTITVTTYQLSPGGELSPPSVRTIPTEEAPVDLGLAPGETERIAHTNEAPR